MECMKSGQLLQRGQGLCAAVADDVLREIKVEGVQCWGTLGGKRRRG